MIQSQDGLKQVGLTISSDLTSSLMLYRSKLWSITPSITHLLFTHIAFVSSHICQTQSPRISLNSYILSSSTYGLSASGGES